MAESLWIAVFETRSGAVAAGATVSTGANHSSATLPSTARTMTVRVYAPAAGKPVCLKVDTAGDPTRSVQTEALTTAAKAWHTLPFNFNSPAAGTATFNPAFTNDNAPIFFNFGTTGAAGDGGTWYFDDLNFEP